MQHGKKLVSHLKSIQYVVVHIHKLTATTLDNWTGEKIIANVMSCEDCNLNLCIKFCQPFHIDADIVEKNICMPYLSIQPASMSPNNTQSQLVIFRP